MQLNFGDTVSILEFTLTNWLVRNSLRMGTDVYIYQLHSISYILSSIESFFNIFVLNPLILLNTDSSLVILAISP